MGFIREVLEIEPTVEQIAICESVLTEQTTCVQAAHGVGKCVAQNELIPLADGREVKAKDLIGKNFELITLDDHGVVIPVKAIAEWNRREPVYEITTESGRRIIRNGHHPLWGAIKWSKECSHPIITDQGWIDVVRMKDYLSIPPSNGRSASVICAVPTEVPNYGDKEIPIHEVKIMAYLIGDGGVTQNQIIFSQKNNAQLAEFAECVSMMGCVLSPRSGSIYDYSVVRPEGDRRTNSIRNLPGLFELGDFSCEEHISTRRFLMDQSISACTFYKKLSVIGVKPIQFYGRSYLSKSQVELYHLFDNCLELVKQKNGFKKGRYSDAIVLLRQKSITVTPPDICLLQEQKKNAISYSKKIHGIKEGVNRNGQKKNPVKEMLDSYGLMGKLAREKEIPPIILSLKKDQLSIFLSRLFSTDGWACVDKNGVAEVGYCTSSIVMATQIQKLLLRFGISANLSHKKTVDAWQLILRASDQIIRFAERTNPLKKWLMLQKTKVNVNRFQNGGKRPHQVADGRKSPLSENCLKIGRWRSKSLATIPI